MRPKGELQHLQTKSKAALPTYVKMGTFSRVFAGCILYGRSGLVVNNTEHFSRPGKQFLLCYRNKNIYLKLLNNSNTQ